MESGDEVDDFSRCCLVNCDRGKTIKGIIWYCEPNGNCYHWNDLPANPYPYKKAELVTIK